MRGCHSGGGEPNGEAPKSVKGFRSAPTSNCSWARTFMSGAAELDKEFIMGKTGTTLWAQVKGVKGQIRLVPKKEGEAKTPGPNQRFKAGANVKQVDQMAEAMGGRGGSGGTRTRRQARRRPFRRFRHERVNGKPDDPPAHEARKGIRARCKGQGIPVIFFPGFSWAEG